MNILLTGSRGFLGSILLFELKTRGYNVFELDRKNGKSQEIFGHKTFDNIHLIIHCAANLTGKFDENVKATQYLVSNYPFASFIFISSAAVYGNCVNAREDDECHPFGEYGLSKWKEEWIIRNKISNYIILRLSNLYGPGSDHGLISNLINGKKKIKLNYPDHFRDYIHVNSVIDFINLMIGRTPCYSIFNLSAGYAISNDQLIKNLSLDAKIDRYVFDNPPKEIAVSVLNNERAMSYGFKPISIRLR
jgi:nucleoside-diphosphate-sugar epimerase